MGLKGELNPHGGGYSPGRRDVPSGEMAAFASCDGTVTDARPGCEIRLPQTELPLSERTPPPMRMSSMAPGLQAAINRRSAPCGAGADFFGAGPGGLSTLRGQSPQ